MEHVQPIEPIKPANVPVPMPVRQVIQHWFIMTVLWGLLYFEIQFIMDILDKWADPLYISNYFSGGGRLAEIVAFGLAAVMGIYTLFITLYVLFILTVKRFRNFNYEFYIRMNSLVLTSFIVYWVLFIALFVRL